MELKKENTLLETSKQIKNEGVDLEPVKFQDRVVGMVGYTSERDKELAQKTLKNIAEGSSCLGEFMYKISNLTQLKENDVSIDDNIIIDDKEYIIDYKKKKAYYLGIAVVNLDNIEEEIDNKTIKLLLTERIKNLQKED